MEDDKLKQLFENYQPAVNHSFMSDLNRCLDAVEIVKARQRQMRVRSRRACLAALIAGFTSGFLSAMAMPYISAAMHAINLNLPPMYEMLPAWMAVAAVVVLTSLTSYNLTFSLQSLSHKYND